MSTGLREFSDVDHHNEQGSEVRGAEEQTNHCGQRPEEKRTPRPWTDEQSSGGHSVTLKQASAPLLGSADAGALGFCFLRGGGDPAGGCGGGCAAAMPSASINLGTSAARSTAKSEVLVVASRAAKHREDSGMKEALQGREHQALGRESTTPTTRLRQRGPDA